jgi:hypothetical protein
MGSPAAALELLARSATARIVSAGFDRGIGRRRRRDPAREPQYVDRDLRRGGIASAVSVAASLATAIRVRRSASAAAASPSAGDQLCGRTSIAIAKPPIHSSHNGSPLRGSTSRIG